MTTKISMIDKNKSEIEVSLYEKLNSELTIESRDIIKDIKKNHNEIFPDKKMTF